MKRYILCLLCLFGAALLLTGCSTKQETFEELGSVTTAAPTAITQTQFTTETETTQKTGIMDANPYDEWAEGTQEDPYAQEALTEEEFTEPESEAFYETPQDIASAESSAVTPYPYAGSTPILLDPIDKPTPTPKAQFTLSYAEYTSPSLRVSFKAPVGWSVDESQANTCIISEPVTGIKDNQQCHIAVYAEPVSGSYDEKALTNVVKQRLNELNTDEITKFEPSLTATRTTIGRKGVYANYKATKEDGTVIGGRVLYVYADKVLYGVEIVYPYGYKASYEPAFGEVRGSLAVQ